MKILNWLVAGLSLAVSAPVASQVTLGQTTGVVEFEASGGSVDGTPTAYAGCRVALTPSATAALPDVGAPSTVILRSITGPCVKGPNVLSLVGLFTGQPNGNYKIWVQLVDNAGNPSAYALAGLVTLVNGKPAPPVNVRVRLVTTIDLPVGPTP